MATCKLLFLVVNSVYRECVSSNMYIVQGVSCFNTFWAWSAWQLYLDAASMDANLHFS